MNARSIECWVKNLGKKYDALIAENLIPNHPLQELYEGRDRLYIEPTPGISLSFWAETKCLETLFITLSKSTPSTLEYKGELPKPFTHVMSQSDVRSNFGEPAISKGPVKMPQPMGITGGQDTYLLDPKKYPNVKVVCKYNSALQVKTLVFSLIDRAHE